MIRNTIKHKLGTRGFYTAYLEKAFKFADLVLKGIVEAPEYSLATASIRALLGTEKFDRAVLDQALRYDKYVEENKMGQTLSEREV